MLRIKNSSAKVHLRNARQNLRRKKPNRCPAPFDEVSWSEPGAAASLPRLFPMRRPIALSSWQTRLGTNPRKISSAKLDVKVADTGRIHVYYCEYAKAEDLAATLAALTSGTAEAKIERHKANDPWRPRRRP